MERVETPGIIGGGVLAEDRQPVDWERRIAERSEALYRARLVLRLLLIWAVPGNLLLAAICVALLGLAGFGTSVVIGFLLTLGSVAVASTLLYRQHFRVRDADSALRGLEAAYREQMLDELEPGDLLDAHKRYRAQLPELVEKLRAAAGRDRAKGIALQAVVIGGSIIVATASAAAMSDVDVGWVAVLLSLLVAVSAAFAGYAKFGDRSQACQQAADALEREYEAVELRVGRYRRFGTEREAYAEFAEAVEALRVEQARWLRSAPIDGLGP